MRRLLYLVLNMVYVLGQRQFDGPTDASNWQKWLSDWKKWRTTTRQQIKYNHSVYEYKDLLWTQTSYMQPQSHPYDKYFYDYESHSYTIDKFLGDLKTRYGGIDSVLVWPTYTNIGIDDRNQYDLIRSLPPGGVSGVAKMVKQLHDGGVRVLWPYNPWDQGTRDEGMTDADALASLINATKSDGFNGDTMGSIPENFFTAGFKYGIHEAMEPEGGGSQDSTNYDTMGWGYWKYPFIPMVDRWKWLAPSRMTNVCRRWGKAKTDDLQAAWFNGDGYETWENVWGTWNGITPRDGEAIRRVATMLRYLGSLKLLITELWEPHTPVLQGYDKGVFASKFPSMDGNFIVWTFVNRAAKNSTGSQIEFDSPGAGYKYYDCYHGVSLEPTLHNRYNVKTVTLSFDIEANGYGCVLSFPSTSTPTGLTEFLTEMQAITKIPLEHYDATWKYLQQAMVKIPATTPANVAPPEMVEIPSGNYQFITSGVEIEGGDADRGVDVQYPWEAFPARHHNAVFTIDKFYMDVYPVTNKDYAEYLHSSGYKPAQQWNYLKHWKNGTFPKGWEKKPVVWISLNEARLYCKAMGKRLPHSYEWQYAAQGLDGRKYPWGNDKDQSKYPTQTTGRTLGPASDVNAHPQGASPFGVQDLVGNVWQMTDEFQDAHTRGLIVKGSSYYRPSGSKWYFPHALELDTHNKYFLMDDSYERAGTLGFRCVKDSNVTHVNSSIEASLSTPPPVVDLTQQGTTDWVHFGLSKVNDINRKSKETILIGKLNYSTPIKRYENNPVSFKWSDGTPTKSEAGTTTGIYNAIQNGGFTITAPAGVKTQKLRIYVGAYKAGRTSVRASLSDGSGTYFDEHLAGSQNGVYEFRYFAKSDGQTIKIIFTLLSADDNITFQAATLCSM